MKILFTLFHPVDPHVAKYIAEDLSNKGFEIFFVIVEKENIIEKIVNALGYDSKVIAENKKTLVGKIFNTFIIDYKLFRFVKKFKPDIIFSPTSPYAGHVAKLLRIPHVCWADTETASGIINSTIPFLDTLFIPKSYYKELNHDKVYRFDGYKEIAYLHPKNFIPNDDVLNEVNVSKNDIIVLMRFSALNALHDIGLTSETIQNEDLILEFIQNAEREFNAKVFISMTERDLDHRFEKYKLKIHPSKYLDLLSFCSLYIGEGTTTASEAGVLGVPWINVQKTRRGYLIDQEKKYQLGKRVESLSEAFNIGFEWLSNNNLKADWSEKRDKLFNEKINVSEFFSWFIVNYPKSKEILKKDPNYQYKFR